MTLAPSPKRLICKALQTEFAYYPRTEYDHGVGIRFPSLMQLGNRWTVHAPIAFAGYLFIHTPLEVR